MAVDSGKYLRASNGDGPAATAILSDDREIGDMSVITDNVLNWPSHFVATVGDLMPSGAVENISIFLGHLEGSIVMIDEFAPGYFDEGYSEGQVIFIKPASAWADIVADILENNTVPPGGQTGQGLIKKSNADGDVEWGFGNADTLDGYHASVSGDANTIPVTDSNGDLDVAGDIYSNGDKVVVDNQKVLWSGAWYMNDAQTATLSELISEQENGIVIELQGYDPSSGNVLTDQYNILYYIPKIAMAGRTAVWHSMVGLGQSAFAWKYLKVYNNKIEGNSVNNRSSVTYAGATLIQNAWVMTKVYGV